MERKKISIFLRYFGVSIFFFGLGWFFGKTFGDVFIEIWKVLLILVGVVLIIVSFIFKKHKK